MAKRRKNAREIRKAPDDLLPSSPFRQAWLRLTPAERLRRSWRLRKFLKNPEAVHDAKTLPQL